MAMSIHLQGSCRDRGLLGCSHRRAQEMETKTECACLGGNRMKGLSWGKVTVGGEPYMYNCHIMLSHPFGLSDSRHRLVMGKGCGLTRRLCSHRNCVTPMSTLVSLLS